MNVAGQPYLGPMHGLPQWQVGYAPGYQGVPQRRELIVPAIVILAIGAVTAVILHKLLGATIPAICVAALSGGAAIVLSPLIGVCLLGFCLPVSEFIIAIPYISLPRAIALLLAISFLPRLLNEGLGHIFTSRALRWYVLLPLWGVMTLPLAKAPLSGVIAVSTFYSLAGMAFLFAAIPTTFRQLRLVCMSAALGGAASGLLGMALGMTSADIAEESGRLAMGVNSNVLALYLGSALLLSGVVMSGASLWTKVLALGVDLTIMVAIGLTNSRGVWFALVAVLFGTVTMAKGVSAKRKLAFLGIGLLIALAGFLLVWGNVIGNYGEAVKERVATITSGEARENSRLTWIWPHYVRMFVAHLATGAGLGTGQYEHLSAHNDMLMFLGELGLIGGLLYLGLFVVEFREVRRNVDPWLRVVGIAMVLFLFAAGTSHTTYLQKHYPILIGVLACLTKLGFCPSRRTTEQQIR